MALAGVAAEFCRGAWMTDIQEEDAPTRRAYKVEGEAFDIGHGDVVIAAITSCTNTSNPSAC